MKKITAIICIMLITSASFAQDTKNKKPSQADIDKAMKQVQELMKNLPPEAKEAMKNMQLPSNADDLKKAKPAAKTDIGTKTIKNIGPAGGIIQSANKKITLNFPAGALTENTLITIEETENGAETGDGNSFQLLPDGLKFAKPVKLILHYTEEDIAGSDPDDLQVITEGKDGDLLFSTTSEVDPVAHTVASDIMHFSKWGMASRLKIQLLPKMKTIAKGEFVNLSVEVVEMESVDVSNKIEKYKQYLKELKESRIPTVSEFQIAQLQQLQTDIDELRKDLLPTAEHKLQYENFLIKQQALKEARSAAKEDKLQEKDNVEKLQEKDKLEKLKSELGISADDFMHFIEHKKAIEATKISVSGWSMNGVAAPASNASGTLNAQGFSAKYTAPKSINYNLGTILIAVNVTSQNKSGKPVNTKLFSKIEIIEKSYFKYTVDGRDFLALELDDHSPDFLKLVKEKGDNVAERLLAICSLDNNELFISGGTDITHMKGQIGMALKIKNPGIGQNLIRCDDKDKQWRNGGRVQANSLEWQEWEQSPTNSKVTRKKMPDNTCDTKDNCTVFEVTLTEYTGINGSTVAGNFSGTLYEDGPTASKGCQSSISHSVSGDFSLRLYTSEMPETTSKPQLNSKDNPLPTNDKDLDYLHKPDKPAVTPKSKPK